MIRRIVGKVRNFLAAPVLEAVKTLPQQRVNVGTQILLSLTYRELAHNARPLPTFDEIGFKEYSGGNEDGILLFIFALIGTTNRKVVDIGAAGLDNSNVANLILNHGWVGLLVDANAQSIAWATKFYQNAPDVWRYPPTLVHAFVTVENINELIRTHGFSGEVDLLCIDIDGVDYWIWKAIDCMQPRVVVVEIQDIIGPERALTVPYAPDFKANDWNYCGASLRAFVKLAQEKGYRLVGCSRYRINAFFVKQGIGEVWLPEVAIESCFKHPRQQDGMAERWAKVKDMPWVEA